MLKNIKKRMSTFCAEKKGDFGVKEIAIMVAIIVIVGVAITIISGNLSGWIDQVWDMALEAIEDFI